MARIAFLPIRPRWKSCLALLPLLFCACDTKDADRRAEDPSYPTRAGEVRAFTEILSFSRSVDLLFMVDNSPSMDPKQDALVKALPKMMDLLQSLFGTSADLHVGVVSSDMGAGSGEGAGGCASVLGNRGLLWGNDPNVEAGFATVKGLKNAAGDEGCGLNAGARWIEDVQNSNGVGRTKNYQGNLTDVLACLTKAVGSNGCGFEHPLLAIRQALNPSDSINPQNAGFLRRDAYLAIVLITDEDDCSADASDDKNRGIFLPKTAGDTLSLRCAARGHVCDGRDIPNYEPQNGYTGKEPFVSKFSDCEAKDDIGLQLPLMRIRDLIDGVAQAKQRPSEQIATYGIIGWPTDAAQAEYRIDKDTTSVPAMQQNLWDYMPVCQVPDVKSADGNIYKAYGGLRLKKFLDAFNLEARSEDNVYSICNPDFSDAMTKIGESIAGVIGQQPDRTCSSLALADADSDLPGIQPECRATLLLPCDTPGQGDCLNRGYVETAIEQCRDGQGHPLDMEEPETDSVSTSVRPCWYFQRRKECDDTPRGVRPKVLTVDGQIPPGGTLLSMECMVCPDGQPGCLF